MSISHDSVNRFLNRESYTGRDLYNEASPTLNLKGGTLSVDYSVLDKPYSQYMAQARISVQFTLHVMERKVPEQTNQ